MPEIIIKGIVGSSAYGLNHSDSDIDYMGIYKEDIDRVFGLTDYRESLVSKNPDIVLHEARKFCRLAIKCNPSIMELLWLDNYETLTAEGRELLYIRKAFLSKIQVRNSYLGYATSQFKKIIDRNRNRNFSADTKNRTSKHARHLLRLLAQGLILYNSGNIPIKLENKEYCFESDKRYAERSIFIKLSPEYCFEFGERIANGELKLANDAMTDYEYAFNRSKSSLLEKPNVDVINDWLISVRRSQLR